jgi:carbon-monoxide dehydrogenase small subunit
MSTRDITLTVNGRTVSVSVEPRRLLVDVLREQLGLTGTHVGCEHGVCGTCTVLRDGRSIRSCTHLRGAGRRCRDPHRRRSRRRSRPAPLQDAFWEKQSLQCGYCTPGMLMRCVEILERDLDPSPESVREQVASNLCRCTGYKNITEAVCAAAETMRASSGAHLGVSS